MINVYYIYNFIFYSIFGYLFEIIPQLFINSSAKSGIMYGPYTIVYGFGITLIYIIFTYTDKKINKTILKYFAYFLTSFVLLTIIEFFGGILIEELFNMVYWDYTNIPLTIGKYINILISIGWAIISIIAYKFLKPISDKLYKKTPNWILVLIAIIMLIDLLLTIIKLT